MRVAALVLAAGASSRYRAGGGRCETKLVDRVEGEPMVRRVARAARDAGLDPVLVVTGHARAAVESALAGLPLRFVHNPAFAEGLSASLRTGLDALDPYVDAALILLGDMPFVAPGMMGRLVAAAADHPGAQAVVPLVRGERGNPVLLTRGLFAPARGLVGDEGARRLLRDPSLLVLELATDDEGTRVDIDEAGEFTA
jgi:molybdenum cofactor cytidylyltransferase